MTTYVPVRDAAAHFQVSERTLRDAIRARSLPGVIRVGRVWRVDIDALERHYAQQQTDTGPVPAVAGYRVRR